MLSKKNDILFADAQSHSACMTVSLEKSKPLFMLRYFLSGISERNARVTMFLFFSLLFLSVTFFVLADETVTDKNIFQDSDQDGLSNDEEALYKTDALDKDTDNDGYTDGVEVESGYDPLKTAPGDKLLPEVDARKGTEAVSATGSVNLTDQVSEEIASMVQENALGAEGSEVTIEDINESVQKIMSQSDQEIILPEVDIDTIKIKKLSKKLSGSRLAEQEKEDAVEYLTVMAYVLANNSPKKFQSENDLTSVISSLGTESLTAITLGNGKYLEELAKKGEKTLEEIKDIEVPEGMLDVHVKAIKMVKYSMQLKDEVKVGGEEDPLRKIASLSKVQGFLGVVSDFSQEVYGRLSDLGIKEIPVNL